MKNLKEDLIAGLDIGTSKITIVTGGYNDGKATNILGFCHYPSAGFCQGAVTDLEGLSKSIAKALEMHQKKFGIRIDSAFVGINGAFIDSYNAKAGVGISDKLGEIRRLDLDRAINYARDSVASFDKKILHQIIQDIIVDGQAGIKEPIGMFGARLEIEVHIVTGLISSVQNFTRAINYTGLEIEDIIFSGLASSCAVLQQRQKELGVILLDIGAGTTEGLIYKDGILKDSFNLPFGGMTITKHISENLKISFDEAEALKKKNKPEIFKKFVEPKLKDHLLQVKKIASKAVNLDSLGAGVVVIGCSSFMEGLLETIESLFGIPVNMGLAKDLVCQSNEILNPIYATSIGLVKYGIEKERAKPKPPDVFKNRFMGAVDRFREFISDYF